MKYDIQMIKALSELGAGTRGARLGLEALLTIAAEQKNSFFLNHSILDVPHTYDDLFAPIQSPHLRRGKAIFDFCKQLSYLVEEQINKSKLPFIFSGDHSSAIGIASGIKKAKPNQSLGLIWIDAHFDIHSPFTSLSGNIHGMPIASLLCEDNINNKRNVLSTVELTQWNKFKQLSGVEPTLHAEHLAYMGVRSYEQEELDIVQKRHIYSLRVKHIRQMGITQACKQVASHLKECDYIYVSFDVDSIDSIISYGTGTPEKDGFKVKELSQLFTSLFAEIKDKVACFEVTEINPTLDCKNNTARIAFKLIEQVRQQLT